ncbi:hypothetical protein A2886_00975 [candidate division WWE3 bacterium RIFCSPHIGHO2_01_FULL_42_13]|uniref:Glycosyltransferase RgtA/B/C/D-like domain-containing protein n=1 Tax=candidate division WWE3 bacterium RIFCSPHIGHO2_01_FULL_42_13 TaxID=1802617 RepID=A0A1F4USQ3_UNCKA|nr:MAG: hypothetical protein A2886_00975 [candidate division WWE3 bacterium RIFCSPHIGHO2_01_FULL_42_13]
MLRKLKFDKILLIILLVGFGLRVAGVEHGFPFIFHPDEPAVVRSAIGLRFDPNPAHFDWPHLHLYLNYFLHFLYIKFRIRLQVFGLQESLSAYFPLMWRDPLIFYFLSRLLNVFMGTLTAIPVYLAGKKLFNRSVGLAAAFALMITPFHVQTSPFALIDIPTAFWVAWAFYFSIKIFQEKDLKNYLWAGLFIGFAASTKYNGGLMAAMIPAAHFLRTWKSPNEKLLDWHGVKALVLSGLVAGLGFILGTPYSVLDFDTFIRTDGPKGALWQFTNVGKVGFGQQIVQFFQALTSEFARDFGYIFILLYMLTIFYAIFVKRTKEIWLILIPSLFLFFYISGFDKTRAHYYTSAYPFVALACGFVIVHLMEMIKSKWRYLIPILLFLVPLWISIQTVLLLVRKDTREITYEWMLENVNPNDRIVYNTSSFLPVMEKFSRNEVEKGVVGADLSFGKGYVVLGLDTGEIGKELAATEGLDQVFEVSTQGRRGPYVFIYVFEQNQEN